MTELRTEYRVVVEYWKDDRDAIRTELHNYYPFCHRYWQRRIAESVDLPAWQPHITRYWIESRKVSDWMVVQEELVS